MHSRNAPREISTDLMTDILPGSNPANDLMVNQIGGYLITAGNHHGLKQIFAEVNVPSIRVVPVFGACVLLCKGHSIEDAFSSTAPVGHL